MCCKFCEDLEYWKSKKSKETKEKYFAQLVIYTWKKNQIAKIGNETSLLTTKPYDLNYCPMCGIKVGD